jgi:glycosyltransferase involved in cell wall biosynthesis
MVMGHNIKFSIIVPAYKTQFFKECIDSILNQTYEDFELIIVNDGSPQGVGSIVAQFRVRKKYGLSIGNIAKLIRKRILRPVFSRKTRGKGYK